MGLAAQETLITGAEMARVKEVVWPKGWPVTVMVEFPTGALGWTEKVMVELQVGEQSESEIE